MVKILGIDPGLAETGVGIVWGTPSCVAGYAHGLIRTPKTDPQALRLLQIHQKISELITRETPDLVIIEDIFSLKVYPKSGIFLGKVSGVILLACAQAAAPAVEVQVRAVKQALTGNGNATKEQVETAVRHHLKLDKPLRPLHLSDAMALALLGLYRFSTLKGGSV